MRVFILFSFLTLLFLACQPAAEKVVKKEESYRTFPQFRKEPRLEASYEEFRKALYASDPWQEYCSGEGSYSLKELVEEAKKKLVYPKGNLVGDWKRGEELVLSKTQYKFLYGRSGGDRRGNCYACHCGDPRIIACGNIGPSLRNYANRSPEPRDLYEFMYNPWIKKPCAFMPRYGHHGIYTPEEIAHILAYLLDRESPINRE